MGDRHPNSPDAFNSANNASSHVFSREANQPLPPRPSRWQYTVTGASVLGLIVAVGLWTKLGYQGWGRNWVNNFSGDILYEMAWMMIVGLIKPELRSRTVAITVFLITAAIEFSQLIPFPQSLVTNLFWRLLMGTTFIWWDFPHYALGCGIGWWVLAQLQHRYLNRRTP